MVFSPKSEEMLSNRKLAQVQNIAGSLTFSGAACSLWVVRMFKSRRASELRLNGLRVCVCVYMCVSLLTVNLNYQHLPSARQPLQVCSFSIHVQVRYM